MKFGKYHILLRKYIHVPSLCWPHILPSFMVFTHIFAKLYDISLQKYHFPPYFVPSCRSGTYGRVRELHRRTLKVDLEDALEGASAT